MRRIRQDRVVLRALAVRLRQLDVDREPDAQVKVAFGLHEVGELREDGLDQVVAHVVVEEALLAQVGYQCQPAVFAVSERFADGLGVARGVLA
jgi:hypothetical protein